MSMPLKTIEPSVGCSRRFIHLRNVDLPPPDGPIITTTSPSAIVVVSPFRTSSFPNDFFSPSIFKSASFISFSLIGLQIVADDVRAGLAQAALKLA